MGGGASAAWRLRWRRARGPGARWACSPFWTRRARTRATRWRRRSATAWTPRWRARPLPPAARESGACVSLTQSWRCPCLPAVRDGLFVCDHTSRIDMGPTLQHQTTQQTGAARALHGGALHASPGRIICGVVAVGAVAPRPCATASAPGRACAQITGDNVLIARETAAALGMGARIRTPEGLPALPPDGRVPRDLGKTLAPLVLACDGFAQARRAPAVQSGLRSERWGMLGRRGSSSASGAQGPVALAAAWPHAARLGHPSLCQRSCWERRQQARRIREEVQRSACHLCSCKHEHDAAIAGRNRSKGRTVGGRCALITVHAACMRQTARRSATRASYGG